MAAVQFARRDLDEVKREICQRIDQLERDFRLLSVGELARRADAIRHLAHGHGLMPVGRLAGGLGDALARGGRGATIRPFVEGMRDAVCAAAQDDATASRYLAAVNLRLAG